MCTFLSISYKDVLIRVLLFTYFKLYVVYVLCTVHGKKKVIQNKLLQINYVLSSTDKHVKVCRPYIN